MNRSLMRSAAVLTGALLLGGVAVGPLQASAVPGWRVTQTFGSSVTLTGVAATSAVNAWAVGALNPGGGAGPLVVRHWNGTAWDPIGVPALFDHEPNGIDGLTEVAGTSATDMWTIGYVTLPDGTDRAYLLHWNGHAWDQQVELGSNSEVDSLIAVGPGNYWAFGNDDTGSVRWHFDGTSWTRSASPSPAGSREIASTNQGAAWVLGSNSTNSNVLVQYLSGSNWVTVTLPPINVPPGDGLQPVAVQVDSPTDVYVLGCISAFAGFVMHYNGHTWTRLFPPNKLYCIDTVANDGNGGLWIKDFAQDAAAYHYNLTANNWSSAPFPTSADLHSLGWIPGTQSVWGSGYQNVSPIGSFKGAVLKYGN